MEQKHTPTKNKRSTQKGTTPVVIFQLADILESKGMTQTRAASLTGIHKNDISRLCRGKSSPSLATLARLCHGLDVSVNDLLLYELV